MSRIGKLPVPVPTGVKVEIEGAKVTVSGPKGAMTREFHSELTITLEETGVCVRRPNDERQFKALHGLTRSLINNMVIGVTQGYSITLEIHGTGYRAELQGKNLVMNLGFSHPVVLVPPVGIEYEVNPRASTITVRGYDKEVVGRLAAEIRGWRPVEPYLGKGIRYQGEVVRRKAGKTGKAG
ncbi:MAG TPA: 50S ribosomal protein L6 [Anaerolineae bacterium]|nr:50S ribosomal protein L6 [Anaerolineae bacterium]